MRIYDLSAFLSALTKILIANLMYQEKSIQRRVTSLYFAHLRWVFTMYVRWTVSLKKCQKEKIKLGKIYRIEDGSGYAHPGKAYKAYRKKQKYDRNIFLIRLLWGLNEISMR